MAKENSTNGFGTAPVFFTAISTILGAILFLRFGYAVGTLGFWGVVLIIILAHLVTIPTALAISELATNKKVEGGGEYFIISRSFGLNIGGTIGIALYFSQAISVAFYVIAFTEAFSFFFDWIEKTSGFIMPRQVISIPAMVGLAILILTKGANIGVKALYWVVGILFISLAFFFLGSPDQPPESTYWHANVAMRNMDSFFIVFAIVFPAFTGMTAGVGLSGDLEKPSRSIPIGTIAGTLTGMFIYIFIIYKLAGSASAQELTDDQLSMARIALYGSLVIPLGLAASTISSALGSIMVAPRTLQALAYDSTFPSAKLNNWLKAGRASDNEPLNASMVTVVIAIVFVAMGSVNAVAEIISMFFMVTYGSLCLISFLNHFGSSPSYRPAFRSKWYISLTGFIVAVWVMFKINAPYAVSALIIISLLYIFIHSYHRRRQGLEAIFANSMFQINRNLQVYLQKKGGRKLSKEWRPSAICISEQSFERKMAFNLLNWISYRYGFGTYLHLIKGYYSKQTSDKARDELKKLIRLYGKKESHAYIDTLISPSYTSAIAQAIQVPGISGMENNMVLFEFDKDNPGGLSEILENYPLVNSGGFDVCIVASSRKEISFNQNIHIWIQSIDTENANLMILMGYIITGHPVWKKSRIRIFEICKTESIESTKSRMKHLLLEGRLPITEKNIEIIVQEPGISSKSIINDRSADAALTIIGFRGDTIRKNGEGVLSGYENVGTILFVNAHAEKELG
ncbi:MAG: amino acid permease [Bacteroidales bacterium]|nr:amino acid permease [Bacteroidales bacterium]